MTLPEATEPIVLQPGEGRSVTFGSGNRCTFKVVGHDTRGQLGLFEYAMGPAAPGARPHLHREMIEIFYVADGEVELVVGERKVLGRAGTAVLVPRNTVHAFSNAGAAPATLLIMFCPADTREEYFEGLAALTRDGQRPNPEALLELMRRYDQEPVQDA
jgi:quercetin dioxygenase-like cupin family protein